VLELQTQQLAASVGLVKALGGGWNSTQLKEVDKPIAAVR
jgi:outer membrane protein TolC